MFTDILLTILIILAVIKMIKLHEISKKIDLRPTIMGEIWNLKKEVDELREQVKAFNHVASDKHDVN